MLAKILQDMWVEPEVLEALSEDQKRILFLKMREEQVRRWREREERDGVDGNINNRPDKVSRKTVRWLLGRDGDVSVTVIGEMDEFRSSKLLQRLLNNRLQSDNMNGIQTVDFLPGREARELGFTQEIHLPLADDYSASPSDRTSSEEDVDSCSADDDLKDPVEDSDSESGNSSDNLSDWAPLYRPNFSSHGNQPPLKAQLSDAEIANRQERGTVHCDENRGRVAQLRKTFSSDLNGTTPAYSKPLLPAKPAHLQKRNTPLIR
ncbi:hypothetical protein JOB18_012118 [Solea senegalensis]|uniref:Uncharacterized protein n=1 Tax=Solea senegalensis TaxID=28829 RepID=A0AAV6SKE7_SOLSE|nr:SH2 domain-containing protein 4A [Solea senegalensis]KAG7517580.1 hypothetical protein JOB18_012118 [Solea senegalensis]